MKAYVRGIKKEKKNASRGHELDVFMFPAIRQHKNSSRKPGGKQIESHLSDPWVVSILNSLSNRSSRNWIQTVDFSTAESFEDCTSSTWRPTRRGTNQCFGIRAEEAGETSSWE